MRPVNESLVRAAACTAVLGVLAACGSGSSGGAVTATVTVTPTASAATPTSGAASLAEPDRTAAASPTATHLTRFKGTCETLLPDAAVTNALGGKPLAGTDSFVVGEPDKVISRLAYLNCRYGVTGTGGKATPKVEIGISLYATPDDAAARLTATADDYAAHGATSTDATVDGLPAMLLSGGAGAGYDLPLLVVASGQRTVAVSVAASVARGDQIAKVTGDLAALALQSTSG